MNILGENIKKARLKKGWTQKQLADVLGVKHNSISDWEKGKSKPYADTLELIMGALDVDANTLLGWNNPVQIKEDAQKLVDILMNDPDIKETALSMHKLSREDLTLAKNFINMLIKEGGKRGD